MASSTLRHALVLVFLPLLVACGDNGNAASEGQRAPESASVDRPPRGTAWVVFDTDTVRAEVAATPAARERGLMHRSELPEGEGMLFIFDEQETLSFWMQNTFIPLDIAFLDRRQVIVDIQQMEPETEVMHESARPAMFALEVPQGWFAAQGIEVGVHARIVRGR